MDPSKIYLRKLPQACPPRGNPIAIPTNKKQDDRIDSVIEIPTEPSTAPKKIVVLRIKRKRGDLPVESLVVGEADEFSKRKTPKIFHLVNTVEIEEPSAEIGKEQPINPALRTNIVKALAEKSKRPIYKAHPSLISRNSAENSKLLRERKVAEILKLRESASRSARFQVISKNRLMPESSDEESDDEDTSYKRRPIALYDAVQDTDEVEVQGEESDITCNLQRLFRQKLNFDRALQDAAHEDYVYDLYEMDESELPFLSNIRAPATISWVDFSDSEAEMMAGASHSSNSVSEDSNAEDYFANDYPDEEEMEPEGYNSYAYDSEQESDRSFTYSDHHTGGYYCEDDTYF